MSARISFLAIGSGIAVVGILVGAQAAHHPMANLIVADVAVSFTGYTNQNSERRMLFVISNAGPRAIEFDIGHFEWADLPMATNRMSAFVMGGSGTLRAGQSHDWIWMCPSRAGTFRYHVPCRRSQTWPERCQEWLYRRIGGAIPKPKDKRQTWLVASPWTAKTADSAQQ